MALIYPVRYKGVVRRLWSFAAGTSGSVGEAVGDQNTGIHSYSCARARWISGSLSVVLYRTCALGPTLHHPQCPSLLFPPFRRCKDEDPMVAAVQP